jgi:hypothetical protein
MKEQIEELKKKFPYIKVEEIKDEIADDETDEVVVDIKYKISNFNGNKNISGNIYNEEQLNQLDFVLSKEVTVLDEFLGVQYNGIYEILLSAVSLRTNIDLTRKEAKIESRVNYFRNELEISIEVTSEERPVLFFDRLIRRGYSRRKPIVLTIKNLKRSSHEGFNNDLRNIVNSVLFDLEFTFGFSLEPEEINNLNRRIPRFKRQTSALPKEIINLTYKKYVPELIQYYHLAERVDYIPFKYICYYHIVEYFSDRSAYYTIKEQIRQLLLKPDFHLKSDIYINQAVNIFKKENEKHLTDKIKLNRTLQQFVDLNDFKNYLDEINLTNHFSSEQIISCSKPLKLPPIDFTGDNQFYQTLASRIYSLRCSIVHSNPDFDETKAVPFVHTSSNLFRLNIELALVYEVARNIIVKSAELR